MEEYIQEALSQGYIRPSTSPAAAGFFFVKKKDGGLRPCIDYRGLNAITKSYAYPLPLVPVALEQLRGATIFTKLDLRSAYNLVRVRKGDEWKTAFLTSRGHYEYKVMSFGLRNAPSVFQAFINDVLRDMLGRFVIAYIDDILIYSPDYSTHVQQVRQVLTRLLEHQLFVKDVPSVEHWMKRSEEVWEETHQRIETVLQRNKRQADKHRRDAPSYAPGDRVWLSTRDFRFSEGCRKLLPKYIGPFKIISKINDVAYKLELPPQYRVCSSFHVSLLKPVVPGPLDEATPETTPPAPVEVEGTPVYAVRRLLDSRRRGGTLQYLVDWEGYGPEERSWVSATDVLDPALREEFHRCHPSRPAPRPRGRPRRLSSSPSTGRRGGLSRRLSLSPSTGRRGGFSLSPSVGPQRGRPTRRVPIPCRVRSRSSLPDGTGSGGGARRGRPRLLPVSDSLGGGVLSCLLVLLPPPISWTPFPMIHHPMSHVHDYPITPRCLALALQSTD
ncbi:hypothetical protein NFI96_013552 [Prochilodus magdalenae]|nr:hypothetical protein NFI96_013552 [Prochilodus magdalenae]